MKAPTAYPRCPEEMNLVATWLDFDRTRIMAGIASGLFAGLVAMGVAGVFSVIGGLEFWFPIKLFATIVCGPSATETGPGTGALVAGLVIVEAISVFFGAIYSHFVKTNSAPALLGMGLVWSAFSWVFIWNLFLPAFRPIFAAHISAGPAFFVCISYGLSMASVAFFDHSFRGNRA